MACRICFESEGSLYNPCKCDGSIKYVHEACLVRWDQMRPQESQGTCELCKESYALTYNRPLETDILSPNPRSYLLINPSWHIASACISTILLMRILPHYSNKFIYLCTHLTYQFLYVVFMNLYVRYTVRHLSAYWICWSNHYARLVLSIHFILLATIGVLYIEDYYNSLVFLSVFNQCYLCVYPIVHTSILNKMNKGRVRVIGNRGT